MEMTYVGILKKEELTKVLSHAGLVLVSFELVKGLIVSPIRAFYNNMNFGDGLPFKSYEQDVLSRHKNEFEACLLYLRDFMQAIDESDMAAIQALREHRNHVAHDLVGQLHELEIERYAPLLEAAGSALFKLSNHRVFMEIGSDPAFQGKGIDWDTVKGSEYLLFEQILGHVREAQRE
jgi:hypothetical protein